MDALASNTRAVIEHSQWKQSEKSETVDFTEDDAADVGDALRTSHERREDDNKRSDDSDEGHSPAATHVPLVSTGSVVYSDERRRTHQQSASQERFLMRCFATTSISF